MILVIGYGNTLRNDDGVGPRAVEHIDSLRLPGVEVRVYPLLTPEIADPVSRAATVIFVDASANSSDEVQLRRLEPAASSQLMAHAANPATLLAIARDVFHKCPEAWLLSIPVQDFGLGESFSALAQGNLERACRELEAFLRG